MTKLVNSIFIYCFIMVAVFGFTRQAKFILDERYVCVVKTSCLECLKLSHCSWCPTESKCFSRNLTETEEYCTNNTIEHVNYGFSIQENAECSCNRNEVEQRCYPPGVTTGPQCSGRGSCVCGQCFCNTVPDPDEPTKMLMGEYCEFDNFSCEGPNCNEGPYFIGGPTIVEDGSKISEVDIPA